jgi:hypothetical protein
MKFLRICFGLALAMAVRAERINHEGRLLGPAPIVTQPILFNTPEADAVVAAMQIMPVTSPWNERIDQRPVLANSSAMIAQISADLETTRRTLRPFFEMNYVLVPDDQPTRAVEFFYWPDESDLDGGADPFGSYPIPVNLPVEGWPVETGGLTLEQWQRDVNDEGGDRHSIIVKPGAGFIWETWLTRLVGTAWEASNGAKFNLHSNALRPAGWTSGDAAGLPMFPALVRYDECQRGAVEHALRLIVKRTRRGPIYPATHHASVPPTDDPNVPAMGQRLRLQASFAIPANWTIQEKAVCLALKKYGALVADNGNFFSVSVCPDNRFPSGCFDHLRTIAISSFEVVATTGPNEGPRSPGAPIVEAGADQVIPFGTSAPLQGTVSGSGVVQWKMGAGPGTAVFANSTQLSTTATFTHPGRYTLLLRADDGIHALTYDTIVVEVMLRTSVVRDGSALLIDFPSLIGRTYRLEWSPDLSPTSWTNLGDNFPGTGATIQIRDVAAFNEPRRFYRVKVLP